MFILPDWEERSFLGFKKDISLFPIQHVYIIRYTVSHYQVGVNSTLASIELYCKKKSINYTYIDLSIDSVNIWNTLYNVINQISNLSTKEIFLDITTMPRNIIWALLFFIKQQNNKIHYIYHQPQKYANEWISKEPDIPRLLFKHSGIMKLGCPIALIILTGFDPERTRQLVNFYEPKFVALGLQTGDQFDNTKRNNEEEHMNACRGLTNVIPFKMDAYTNDQGFSSIEKQLITLSSNYNIIATSLGPKISALSLYYCYHKNPEIALCYIPCKEYNIKYCEGISNTFNGIINF